MLYIKFTDKEIERQYSILKDYYNRYLKKFGVQLPKLKDKNGKFTKSALVLVYLSHGYPKTREVTKTELTQFIREYYPNINDVQQARHLGAQDGWYIVGGSRDNIVLKVARGNYQLYSLERVYPEFTKGHRVSNTASWDQLKVKYGYRCVTCGSREGEPHFHWPGTKTVLQRAHKDPNKPLKSGNIIPQCQKCNRADRNRWVYDDKGRVIKLADPRFILNFDQQVLWKMYHILYKKYKGQKPDAKK